MSGPYNPLQLILIPSKEKLGQTLRYILSILEKSYSFVLSEKDKDITNFQEKILKDNLKEVWIYGTIFLNNVDVSDNIEIHISEDENGFTNVKTDFSGNIYDNLRKTGIKRKLLKLCSQITKSTNSNGFGLYFSRDAVNSLSIESLKTVFDQPGNNVYRGLVNGIQKSSNFSFNKDQFDTIIDEYYIKSYL